MPDPRFSSVKYAKFINYLMERGKKSVSQKIFYTALEIVKGLTDIRISRSFVPFVKPTGRTIVQSSEDAVNKMKTRNAVNRL